MKRIIITIILVVFGIHVSFSQSDESSQSELKVKYFTAEELLKNKEYSKAIDKVMEIEAMTNGSKASVLQTIKIKSYTGLYMFEQAKKELNVLYSLNPTDSILKSIISYVPIIDEGILKEIQRKESARLAKIEREEQARLAEERRIEAERLAAIRKKEEERIEAAKRLERERQLLEEKEWSEAVKKASYQENIKDIRVLYRIRFKDKFGFIDSDKKVVIPLKYDFAGVFKMNKLCSVQVNEKWGAINAMGEIVVPIIYDNAGAFNSENYSNFFSYYIVEKNGKAGVIDTENNNKIVIPFIYDKLNSAGNDILLAIKGNKKGAVNGDGNEIIPIRYDDVWISNDRLSGFLKEKNETVYYNRKGEIIKIENEGFDRQGKFNNGYAIVEKGENYGIVNQTGKITVPVSYKDMTYLENGLYKVLQPDSNSQKKYGVIKGNGDIVLSFKYRHIGSFKYGWANFCEKFCGFVDLTGKIIGTSDYASVREPDNNTAVASKNIKEKKLFGAIDNKGVVIIPFEYQSIEAMEQYFDWGHKGKDRVFYLVEKNENYGVFDSSGRNIIKIKYDNIEGLNDGAWNDRYSPFYFIVTKDKLKGVFDHTGKMIIPIKYSKIELENGPYNSDYNQFYLYDKNGVVVNKFDLRYDKKGIQEKKIILIK